MVGGKSNITATTDIDIEIGDRDNEDVDVGSVDNERDDKVKDSILCTDINLCKDIISKDIISKDIIIVLVGVRLHITR
jgi:hypothetical protein